jgi:tubby-related protein 1
MGYLGKVRSNFLGTEFYIFDSKENPKKAANTDESRLQLGVI